MTSSFSASPGEDTSWYENPRGKETVRRALGGVTKIFDKTDSESPGIVDLFNDGKPGPPVYDGGQDRLCGFLIWPPRKNPGRFTPSAPTRGINASHTASGMAMSMATGKNDLLVHDGWYEQPAKLDGDPEWVFHKADFGSGGAQMFAYDVNGDGRPDVITSLEAHGYGLAWFEQKADGSFEKTASSSAAIHRKIPRASSLRRCMRSTWST